ncbi:hypothetical protein [Oligoflexus tunisiensis]|uniref:hypothetical protein n=1 Tax=Oligoflexus tunisiensis TaxID=708132 RepID=UPI001C401C89|nr:hypothetical protein [Oligoflexus tunisiensis]
MMILAAPALYAQETSSETVVVTGSRLPYTAPGPIADTGGGPNPDIPCAEPNCGQDPEDPSGGGYLTQAQKNQDNKRAQEKAKNDSRLKAAVQATTDLLAALKKWFASKGIELGIGAESYERTIYPNGVKKEKGWCASAHGTYGAPNPNYKDPCVEVDGQPEVVKRVDGTLENQVRLTYTVYEQCYFDRTCGPKSYSFVAGSPEELDWLMQPLLQ